MAFYCLGDRESSLRRQGFLAKGGGAHLTCLLFIYFQVRSSQALAKYQKAVTNTFNPTRSLVLEIASGSPLTPTAFQSFLRACQVCARSGSQDVFQKLEGTLELSEEGTRLTSADLWFWDRGTARQETGCGGGRKRRSLQGAASGLLPKIKPFLKSWGGVAGKEGEKGDGRGRRGPNSPSTPIARQGM